MNIYVAERTFSVQIENHTVVILEGTMFVWHSYPKWYLECPEDFLRYKGELVVR